MDALLKSITSFIYLFIFTSIWYLNSTNYQSAKEKGVGQVLPLPASDFTHQGSEMFYPDVLFYEKKKSSMWPLCGASSFVGCLSACSWWKGTFSLTGLEKKASAYSQPWNLLAKFLSAIWKISHMAQLKSCDPDGELKVNGGGRGWRGLAGSEEQWLESKKMCSPKLSIHLDLAVLISRLIVMLDRNDAWHRVL